MTSQAPVHYESRNFPAHVGLSYSQNRWNSSRKRWARTLFKVVAQEIGQPRSLVVDEIIRPLESGRLVDEREIGVRGTAGKAGDARAHRHERRCVSHLEKPGSWATGGGL